MPVSRIGWTTRRVLPTFGAALPQVSYSACKQLIVEYATFLAAKAEMVPNTNKPLGPFMQAYRLTMNLDRS